MNNFAQSNESTFFTLEQIVDFIRGLESTNPDRVASGDEPISEVMIDSAVSFCNNYLKTHSRIPHGTYALPDGNVAFEWCQNKKVVERIEVEGPFKATRTIRQPGESAKFSELSWKEGEALTIDLIDQHTNRTVFYVDGLETLQIDSFDRLCHTLTYFIQNKFDAKATEFGISGTNKPAIKLKKSNDSFSGGISGDFGCRLAA